MEQLNITIAGKSTVNGNIVNTTNTQNTNSVTIKENYTVNGYIDNVGIANLASATLNYDIYGLQNIAKKELNATFNGGDNGGMNSYVIKGGVIPKVIGKVGYRVEFETLTT